MHQTLLMVAHMSSTPLALRSFRTLTQKLALSCFASQKPSIYRCLQGYLEYLLWIDPWSIVSKTFSPFGTSVGSNSDSLSLGIETLTCPDGVLMVFSYEPFLELGLLERLYFFTQWMRQYSHDEGLKIE